MTEINTSGELKDLETLLGVTFESGNVYTFQVEGQCYLKIGEYDECLINSITPFTYEADGTGMKIKTLFFPCQFKIVSMKAN